MKGMPGPPPCPWDPNPAAGTPTLLPGPPLTGDDQQPHGHQCQGAQQVLARAEPVLVTSVWCPPVRGRHGRGGAGTRLMALPSPQPLHVIVAAGAAPVLR